jgi:hypothetical protein
MLDMKKTIIVPLLALFIGITFSSTAISGIFDSRYKCRLKYTKLDAATGKEEQDKSSYYIADDAGCDAGKLRNGLSKRIQKWFKLSDNNIIVETSWEGLECKKDEASLGFLFDHDWGSYSVCSANETQRFIDKLSDNFQSQVSNKVKYPQNYPPKSAHDDDVAM